MEILIDVHTLKDSVNKYEQNVTSYFKRYDHSVDKKYDKL